MEEEDCDGVLFFFLGLGWAWLGREITCIDACLIRDTEYWGVAAVYFRKQSGFVIRCGGHADWRFYILVVKRSYWLDVFTVWHLGCRVGGIVGWSGLGFDAGRHGSVGGS